MKILRSALLKKLQDSRQIVTNKEKGDEVDDISLRIIFASGRVDEIRYEKGEIQILSRL